jgi:hypothetical protein
MWRRLDQMSALVLLALGMLHIAAASPAFVDPSPALVWFLSAGALGVVAGLASFARIAAQTPSRLMCLCAVAGAGSIAMIGALLLIADGFTFGAGLIALATGAVSALFAARDLMTALTRDRAGRTAR